jgi:hypothetical protein
MPRASNYDAAGNQAADLQTTSHHHHQPVRLGAHPLPPHAEKKMKED